MDAIVLAGGFGTRLRSVVSGPKAMAPVDGRPFLSYIFEYLSRWNISQVILSLGYLSETIIKWVNAQNLPFSVVFSVESVPLGTGGGVKRAISFAKSDNVLVLNGDTFFDVNIRDFELFHEKLALPISVALKPMEKFNRYGSVKIEGERIVKFEEKKFCEEGYINGGVYLLRRENLFNGMPDCFSMESDFLAYRAVSKQIGAYVCGNYFIDIGIPSDYQTAQTDFIRLFK